MISEMDAESIQEKADAISAMDERAQVTAMQAMYPEDRAEVLSKMKNKEKLAKEEVGEVTYLTLKFESTVDMKIAVSALIHYYTESLSGKDEGKVIKPDFMSGAERFNHEPWKRSKLFQCKLIMGAQKADGTCEEAILGQLQAIRGQQDILSDNLDESMKVEQEKSDALDRNIAHGKQVGEKLRERAPGEEGGTSAVEAGVGDIKKQVVSAGISAGTGGLL